MRNSNYMILNFEFSGYFKDIVGIKKFTMNLESENISLKEAIHEFLQNHSDFVEEFERKGMLVDGKLNGLFITENNLLQMDSQLKDNAVIKVLPPIFGG
jgi:hypothetical protein